MVTVMHVVVERAFASVLGSISNWSPSWEVTIRFSGPRFH